MRLKCLSTKKNQNRVRNPPQPEWSMGVMANKSKKPQNAKY